jgi:hypothetical protein
MAPRALVTLTLILAACSGPTAPEAPEAFGRQVAEDRAPTTVLREYATGVTSPASGLIVSMAEWQRLWKAVHQNRAPLPALPAVDFSEEALVFVALGNTANGASPQVEHVDVYERGLVARVTIDVPSQNCLILTAIFQPLHVVRIARPAARTLYVDRREVVRTCN